MSSNIPTLKLHFPHRSTVTCKSLCTFVSVVVFPLFCVLMLSMILLFILKFLYSAYFNPKHVFVCLFLFFVVVVFLIKFVLTEILYYAR